MKKLHPPAPPPPKVFLAPKKLFVPQSCHMSHVFISQEITVVAGDGKPVKIHLGGENELEDCRRQVTVFHSPFMFLETVSTDYHHKMAKHSEMASKHNLTQVAEAAGLKHVALPEFENADGRYVRSSFKHGYVVEFLFSSFKHGWLPLSHLSNMGGRFSL